MSLFLVFGNFNQKEGVFVLFTGILNLDRINRINWIIMNMKILSNPVYPVYPVKISFLELPALSSRVGISDQVAPLDKDKRSNHRFPIAVKLQTNNN